MKYIIYQQSNNKIAITLSTGALPIEEIIKRDVPSNAPYKVVDTLNIDLEFQEAYSFVNNELKLDLNLAKEVQKNKWRIARNKIFEKQKLDVEYMRALEAGDIQKQQEIATKKQALRDVTNTPLPNDLEGIKNTWPDVLNS